MTVQKWFEMKRNISLLVIIGMTCLIFKLMSVNKCDTSLERKNFLNTIIKDVNIVSERNLHNFLICQIERDTRSGCAIFEEKKVGYKYMSHILSSEDVVIDSVYVHQKLYHVLICNKPMLERVVAVYSNPDSSEIIERVEIELNGATICILESVNASSYVLDVTFYDNNGNLFN